MTRDFITSRMPIRVTAWSTNPELRVMTGVPSAVIAMQARVMFSALAIWTRRENSFIHSSLVIGWALLGEVLVPSCGDYNFRL